MLVSSAAIERLVGHCLGDCPQIVGDQAPADPAFHPVVAMIPTAIQAMAAFEPTDASLNAGTPAASASEPVLCFMRSPLLRLRSWLGNHDLFDPFIPRIPFPCRRVCAAIAGQQARGFV